jgi:16S rRNA (guanine527-N7)-methyltransferase
MSKNDITEALVSVKLEAAGLAVESSEARALTVFLNLLRQWNRVHNLTGIRDADELIDRHLGESLALRRHLHGREIADVGSGAGLPGIPLAVVERERHFTLIESRAKRAAFLRHVAGALGLGNVTVEHCRVEDLPGGAHFDTVLARAVAPPAELIRMTRDVTRPGSILLLLTAAHVEQELRGLPPGYVLRPLGPDAIPPSVTSANGVPRSTIVRLERTNG